MKLLEVWRDFKIEVVGSSQHGRYKALYIVVPRENAKPITLEDLKEYIEKLKQKYPQRQFYLRRYKNYVVLTQKTVIAPSGVHGEIKKLRKIIRKYQRLMIQTALHQYLIYKLREQIKQLSRQITVKKDAIPIYFDLQNQRIYVPKTYMDKKPKLANYILMRTLGALGLTKTRYKKIIGRK